MIHKLFCDCDDAERPRMGIHDLNEHFCFFKDCFLKRLLFDLPFTLFTIQHLEEDENRRKDIPNFETSISCSIQCRTARHAHSLL